MSAGPVPVVGLDQTEAVELSELCEFMAQWLSHAGRAVAASLDARIGTTATPSSCATSCCRRCW